jgi:hypothetical protein
VNVHRPRFEVFVGVQVTLGLHEHVLQFPLGLGHGLLNASGQVPVIHQVSEVVEWQVRYLTLVSFVEM